MVLRQLGRVAEGLACIISSLASNRLDSPFWWIMQ